MRKILFFLFILFLIGSASANILNYELKTSYPDSEPYFLGTKVNEIRIWITDDQGNLIANDYTKLEVKIGEKNFVLYKVNNVFSNTEGFIINEEYLKNNLLIIEVKTPVENVTNVIKTYNIKNIDDFLKYDLKVEDTYNAGQMMNIQLNIKPLKENIGNVECYLFNPKVKKNKFNCENNTCTKKIFVPVDLNDSLNLEIFCSVPYLEKLLPLYINKKIKIAKNLKINIVNPDNAKVKNPFYLIFSVKYENGLNLEDDALSVFIDGKEKNVTVVDKGVYSINQLLMPYTNYKKKMIIKYKGIKYEKDLDIDLKPTSWFWITILIIILIFLANTVFIVMRLFKKEDVNELIAERDLYVDKLKGLKEQYLSGAITKATFDELTEEYELKIASLNDRIIKLKKSTPKKQMTAIKNIKKQTITEKKIDADELLQSLGSKKPKPKKESKTIFTRIFEKKEKKEEPKPKVDNSEEKKELPKQEVSGFDISKWKKK